MRAPLRTFRRARELRRGMSLPEIVLWQAMRNGKLAGLRFRRQHPIGPYILDFYCPAARLAVRSMESLTTARSGCGMTNIGASGSCNAA